MEVHDIISASRIRWSLLTNAQIQNVWVEAVMYQDRTLIRRARRALARRRWIASAKLQPVQGVGSTWGAGDPAGGVWWPRSNISQPVDASTVCTLATEHPHLGSWYY